MREREWKKGRQSIVWYPLLWMLYIFFLSVIFHTLRPLNEKKKWKYFKRRKETEKKNKSKEKKRMAIQLLSLYIRIYTEQFRNAPHLFRLLYFISLISHNFSKVLPCKPFLYTFLFVSVFSSFSFHRRRDIQETK